AGSGPCSRIPLSVKHFHAGQRLVDEQGGKRLDDAGDAGRTEAFVVFRPADNTRVGCDLHKVVVAPAGVAAQCLHIRYDHAYSPVLSCYWALRWPLVPHTALWLLRWRCPAPLKKII